MSAKHTPGPWIVSLADGAHHTLVRAQDASTGRCIASTFVSQPRHKTEDGYKRSIAINEANARIIAAAPDLLEALQSAKTYIADLEKRIRDGVYKSEELKDPNAWKDVDDFAFNGIGASYHDEIDAALSLAKGEK